MKKRDVFLQSVLWIYFAIACILIIFPFWMLVSVSISNSDVIAQSGYQIIPNPVDFQAYRAIFANPEKILTAYGVTFVYSIIAMVLGVLLMSMIAYPLSRNSLKGRGVINFFLYFTMLFSGGLVPSYILFTNYLHFDNTLWIYIIPGLISPWYVFMIRTFFKGIPFEIVESATVDGASEYRIFAQFIIPLSKPVIATIALFVFLNKWNDWYTALIYIDEEELFSLQYLLQSIMKKMELLKANSAAGIDLGNADIPSETGRMAMAVIVAGPALVVFPFFQKYFVKGLTVGSVKG